jgi:hypothetical protein
MSDGDDQDKELLVSDLTQHAIVTDAISPDSGEIAAQGLAKSAWIVFARYPRIKIAKDLLLNLPIEFQELLTSRLGKTIGPIHALFPERSRCARDF